MLSLLLGNYSNWGYSIIVNEEKGSLTTCKKNYADSIYVRLLVYIKIILWYYVLCNYQKEFIKTKAIYIFSRWYKSSGHNIQTTALIVLGKWHYSTKCKVYLK